MDTYIHMHLDLNEKHLKEVYEQNEVNEKKYAEIIDLSFTLTTLGGEIIEKTFSYHEFVDMVENRVIEDKLNLPKKFLEKEIIWLKNILIRGGK